MLKYICKRILILIPVLIAITIILFCINKMMPGDPVRAMLPTTLKAEQYDNAYNAMKQRLGLDKSLPEQYFRWVTNMLQGEFGWSSKNNRPVADVVAEPIRNTVILNIGVILLELAIALPVGIKCAVKRGKFYDNFWQVFSLITWSMPSFFIALCLLYVFAAKLNWLPFGGMPNAALTSGWAYYSDWLRHLVLPVVVLSLISIASSIRIVRNAMIDALSQDYIRTARAKGLREKTVIYSHAFRNALIPVSTVVVGTIFSLFAGSTITETIFAWNGIGKVLIDAINSRDTMLVSTMNTFFALVSVTAVLVSDITYGLIDPRVRLE
ncbi:MAG: ABC transporter permease [Clostridia bacterium]|nr:ABC transporter permease [Clostridia bacterium]